MRSSLGCDLINWSLVPLTADTLLAAMSMRTFISAVLTVGYSASIPRFDYGFGSSRRLEGSMFELSRYLGGWVIAGATPASVLVVMARFCICTALRVG
jgi:hypothetical protein